MEALTYWVGMFGIVAFAITGVLAVAPKGIDVFGATVMGVITAIGGGTMRDVILGVPVFWSIDLNYIWVAIGASLAAFVANSLFTHKQIFSLMLYIDGIGVALFSIQATHKVWDMHFGLPVAPVIMGVLSAIGGGLIRDVLAGNQTLLMSRDIYATPVLLGCVIYVMLLGFFPEYEFAAGVMCILFIFALRAAAIHWNLSIPDWAIPKPKTR